MRLPLFVTALLFSTSASSEVVHSTSSGFEIQHSVPLVASPDIVWTALGRIGGWWAPAHTYSGSGANMSIQLRPGGCFCERIPDEGGGIEHMRVTYAVPGKRVVMSGGLGPLLYEAAVGVMDIRIESSGSGSKVLLNYRAAGFYREDAPRFAPVVDKVLGEQLKRLRAYVAKNGSR